MNSGSAGCFPKIFIEDITTGKMDKLCLNINRRLLPVKFHYFLFMAALACALPFRTVFAKQLGISATAVGIIFCAIPILRIFTNPLFGFLLDYFKRFRLTLSIIMIFVALSHVAMVFVPPKSIISQNKSNVSEKDFHSKLTCLWANDSTQSPCHPKFLLNSEYSLYQDLTEGVNSFICDIQCFKPKNDFLINTTENEFQCNKEMKAEFKVIVHISDCDINIELEKGQLAIFHAGERNLLLFEANNALAKNIVSSISPSENCSAKEIKIMTSPLQDTHKNVKKKSSNQGEDIDTFKLATKNVNNEVPENLGSGNKKYNAQSEFIINFSNKKLCMDDRCSQEFECLTKKCSFYGKRNENNVVQFNVEENEFLSAQFWSFFILMAVSNVTFTAIIFMMDAVCYELLKERKDKYGQQRLWGAVGWGVGALAGGCLNQIVTSDSGEIDYSPGFYLLAILALIDLIPLYHLKVTDLKYSSHIWKDVCFLFSKMDIVYNILIVYIIGVLSGFIWNYQFWFMQEIGSSQVLLGLSQTAECLFELPFFFVSGWIIQKIGHDHCNSLTLLCFGLRYLCFAVMYDPWWTLATAILHGPTFGLFYASMTMYAKKEAPAGTEATVQSLLHLCFEGTGVATGSILGGLGLDKFGSRMSFIYAAEISFCLLLVNILVSFYISKSKKESKQIKVPVVRDDVLKL